jgi:gp16 family phage-associated protein
MVSPSRSKALKARARLLEAGYTLSDFAREKNFPLSTVKAAINGGRGGPRSQAVLAAIREVTTK